MCSIPHVRSNPFVPRFSGKSLKLIECVELLLFYSSLGIPFHSKSDSNVTPNPFVQYIDGHVHCFGTRTYDHRVNVTL